MAEERSYRQVLERLVPGFLRRWVKRAYWRVRRRYDRLRYMKTGEFVEFGYRFRFSRKHPYGARVGSRTITDEFNVWNAKAGDIVVGEGCWFGLHNIIMGPVEIGDGFASGPYVCILGPRHPVAGPEDRDGRKTVIGKNAWVSTGSLILFGVTIGDNVIISAGSVVTKDVPDGAFVGGNPARNLSAIARKTWKREGEEQ